MPRILRLFLVSLAAALALTGSASAAGGDYVFEGGSKAARTQVRAALAASSFDWDTVPAEVTIHIRRGVSPEARPGDIWLDSNLLASGRFSWGIVQHEYAHQVAFFNFGKAARARLTTKLGGQAWCHEKPNVAHDENTCERFAHTLSFAFWPASQNVERDEAVMAPAKFRALVGDLLAA